MLTLSARPGKKLQTIIIFCLRLILEFKMQMWAGVLSSQFSELEIPLMPSVPMKPHFRIAHTNRVIRVPQHENITFDYYTVFSMPVDTCLH